MRVLHIAGDSIAATHGCAVLAALGLDVEQVVVDDRPALAGRGPWITTDGAERSVPVVLAERAGLTWRPTSQASLERAVELADVVVTSEPADLPRRAGRLGTVVVSPFGSTGPRSGWRARSQSLFHAGGPGFVTPRAPQGGAHDGAVPPSAPWGHVADRLAGCFVAQAVLALGLGGDRGQVIDLSVQECLLPLVRRELAAWRYEGYRASRYERLWKVAPSGFYATTDGVVYLMVVEARQWEALCNLVGRPELAADDRFATGERRFEHLAEVEEVVSAWTGRHTGDEVFAMCGEHGVPATPVLDPQAIAAVPALMARGFFRDDGTPRLPVRWRSPGNGTWARLDDVGARAPDRAPSSLDGAVPGRRAPLDGAVPGRRAPLDGVRVLELTHVWAGPLCGQFLADLGADVVRVESRSRIDVHRRAGPYAPGHQGDIDASGVWNAQNRGKRSCVVEVQHPECRALVRRLVERADVLIENFRPGALAKLGLGYEDVAPANPGLVYVSLSGFGQSGPLRGYPAYGPAMDALAGLAFSTRGPEGEPCSVNGWIPDVSGGAYAAAVVLWALSRRDEGTADGGATRRAGGWFDVAELETSIALCADAFVVARARTEPTPIRANADPEGGQLLVCPAAGDDAWVAVRIADGTTLDVAVGALGGRVGDGGGSPALDLRRLLAGIDADAACETLQRIGVEAVPVAPAAKLAADRHLLERGALVEVHHPVAGADLTYGPVLRVGGRPMGGLRPAPRFGEHTRAVLGDYGVGAEEIARLQASGLVGEPDAGVDTSGRCC